MKFVSAIFVALAASSVQAGFIRRRLDEEEVAAEEMPAEEPTYIPPKGFKPVVWPTPPSPPVAEPSTEPAPVEPEVPEGICTASIPKSIDDEYIVVQYSDSTSISCLDLDDPVDQKAMSDSFLAAYSSIDGGCAQTGAFCGIYSAELVAQDKDNSSFLLRVGSFCNSWVYLNDDKDLCGVQLFDVLTPEVRRELQEPVLSGEECSCPRPTSSDVISAFNTGVDLVISLTCPTDPPAANDVGIVERPAVVPLSWAEDAYQLCELECVEGTTIDSYSYTAEGVSAPCDKPDVSLEPTEAPSESLEPTEAPSDEPTEAPSESLEPTEGTEEPSEEPTATSTEAPVEATEAPVEATLAPVEVTEPVEETDAPTEETDAPTEETDAPVAATEAPVAATEAPVAATEAPVAATEAPVAATEAPVAATEAPVASTEAPVAATEAPVAATEAPVAATEAPVAATEAPVLPTDQPTEETDAPTGALLKSVTGCYKGGACNGAFGCCDCSIDEDKCAETEGIWTDGCEPICL